MAAYPLPALIIMDYNIVPEHSLSLLQRLKQNEQYKNILIIIISENNLPQYKQQCYALGASSFVQKPHTLEETKNKIVTFFKYWFEVAEV